MGVETLYDHRYTATYLDCVRRYEHRPEVCESRAAHCKTLTREELAAVIDTFPVLQRRELRECGEFRTKRLVLERYDAMAEAASIGRPYRTILDPHPAPDRATARADDR